MLNFPHYAESMAYVRYQDKQHALDILLDLETDPIWQSTLVEYGRFLEDETLSTTDTSRESAGRWLEDSTSDTSK